MTIEEFINTLSNLSFESEDIDSFFRCFIADDLISEYEDESKRVKYKEDAIAAIWKIGDEAFTAFNTLLDDFKKRCENDIAKNKKFASKVYSCKMEYAMKIIQDLQEVYQKVKGERYPDKSNDNSKETTDEQQRKNVAELKAKIDDLYSRLEAANNLMENKTFALLVNTVSILGIFVAIAYTGFGVVSLFSSIDLGVSIKCTTAFLKNIFFLLLTALLSYNLLLLLVYFIFKLSRPISFANTIGSSINNKNVDQPGFKEAVNLCPFLVVDAVLLVITGVFFYFSIK